MSNEIDLVKNLSIENRATEMDKTSRRAFVRSIGKAMLSISVVGWVSTSAKMTLAACGEGVSDSACGSNYGSDGNCGMSDDPDNNCGLKYYNSGDFNCGKPSSGGVPTGGPNGTDRDEACMPAVSDSDNNCSIAQVPVGSYDIDESCNNNKDSSDMDQSCGDCDDNHQSDEHCGIPITTSTIDPDDLCGHQHAFSGSQDQACSTSVRDVGCGRHTTVYGGKWIDPDQSCSGSTVDMNCATMATDTNCGKASNPSTTSPDERCGSTGNPDVACSRYDKDESCGIAVGLDELQR
jgi:hypothetical protein